MNKYSNKKTGFTLIEMMVAVFVFSIVMTIATGAIFSIVNANKTSQALKSVLDNLSSAVDSMSRNIRYGHRYHCGPDPSLSSSAVSCPEGLSNLNQESFAFLDKFEVFTIYQFRPDDYASDGTGYIEKCIGNTSTDSCSRLTAPEVHIKALRFYVTGAQSGEVGQPLLLMTVSGYSQAGSNKSDFNLETLVSQRNPECKDAMIEKGICQNQN